MTFEFFISLRYLVAKRRQTFISLITFISIAGVAVGVMALIVVLAVMNGFQEDLRERILGVTSHVVVGHFEGAISDYKEIIEKIRREPSVVAATPYIYAQVMISSEKGAAGIILRGVDIQTASQVTNIEKNLIRGSLRDLKPRKSSESNQPPGVILGVELANQLGVGRNNWINLISPAGRLTPLGHVPKSKLFRVVAIFQSGMFEYDNTLAYAEVSDLQRFLGLRNAVSGIEIKVADIYNAGDVAERLQSTLGYPFWVRDWMQMNRNLFSALKLEKVVMFIILTLIILVAAFSIVGSLIMLVMEKTRDIAILKTMGTTTASIRKIFIWEGLFIGVMGTLLGLVGGFTLCSLLKRYQFIELPRDVYYISTLPVQMEALDVVFIALSAIVISLVATLYPSRQATKLDPVEALRYE
jgi:lipoprotein-releasing system permease protein